MAETAKKKTTKKKAKAKDAEAVEDKKPAKETEAAAEAAVEKTLEELVLSKLTGKYQVVDSISNWAKHLRQQEEHRHLTQTEVVELAMREVLSGKVSDKEIAKNTVSTPPPGSEELATKPAAKK